LGVQKLRKPLYFGCIFSPLSAPLAPRTFYFPLGGLPEGVSYIHSPCTPIWAPNTDTDTDYRLPFPGVVAHHLSDFQG
jgi:hypothetical protein